MFGRRCRDADADSDKDDDENEERRQGEGAALVLLLGAGRAADGVRRSKCIAVLGGFGAEGMRLCRGCVCVFASLRRVFPPEKQGERSFDRELQEIHDDLISCLRVQQLLCRRIEKRCRQQRAKHGRQQQAGAAR
jgi:hypothetical protein